LAVFERNDLLVELFDPLLRPDEFIPELCDPIG
jgi:hypothetical protein